MDIINESIFYIHYLIGICAKLEELNLYNNRLRILAVRMPELEAENAKLRARANEAQMRQFVENFNLKKTAEK